VTLQLPGSGAFRLLLGLALALITWIATTELPGPVIFDLNDKLNHLAAFFTLALLSDFAFRGSGFGPAKFLPLLGYGLLLESVQHFLPYRDFSLLDLGADALGMTLYAASIPLLRRHPPFAGRWQELGVRS
jgi:VanZ family protein